MRNLLLSSTFCFLSISSASAQIVADEAFGTEVSATGSVGFSVEGGRRAGSNLYHSFKQFSVQKDKSVTFMNSREVDSVLVRVTSGNGTSIDGRFSASNPANFYIVSPGGISFGEDASIALGGSLFATTAGSLIFEDSTTFGLHSDVMELSSQKPMGARFSSGSERIRVNDGGVELSVGRGTPAFRLHDSHAGLSLQPNSNLLLLGNGIEISGAVTIPSGRLEIGSVSQGDVLFSSNPTSICGTCLDYEAVNRWNNISLSGTSIIDVSGNEGTLNILGREVFLLGNAKLVNQSFDFERIGSINIYGTERVEMRSDLSAISVDQLSTRVPVVLLENVGQEGGHGGINISARHLSLDEGSIIASLSYSSSPGGDININVSESVTISGGLSELEPSIITSQTYGGARSGDVLLKTKVLSVLNGGRITSSSFGFGDAGSVNVLASKANIAGTLAQDQASQSGIASDAFREGNSGDLFVSTKYLTLSNGGDIVASTFSEGNAGSVSIVASESIDIGGAAVGFSFGLPVINPSEIASAAQIQPEGFRQIFGLPPVPTGKSGDVEITTPKMIVSMGAKVAVANDGPQDAGDIRLTTDRLILNEQAAITAETANGQGGNILLNINEALALTGNSNITTSAQGPGNGGNIDINSDFIVAGLLKRNNNITTLGPDDQPFITDRQDNNITANAIDGNGGNINITTLGLYGIDATDIDLLDRNDITATSENGLDGTIIIDNLNLDPIKGLFNRSEGIDIDKLISNSCMSDEIRAKLKKIKITTEPQKDGTRQSIGDPWPLPSHAATYSVPFQFPPPPEEAHESMPIEADWVHIHSDGRVTLGQRCATRV